MDGHMEFVNDRVREYKGFKLRSTDPYGLWSIHATKGSIPDMLKGSSGSLPKDRLLSWYETR
jgi:hypothetical protein